jgi:hypothetical protein
MKQAICEKRALAKLPQTEPKSARDAVNGISGFGQHQIESGAGLLQPRMKPTSNPEKSHRQPGNLKLAICVLQLKVPLDFKYSLV